MIFAAALLAASLPGIHSHNDYWRARPVFEAIEAKSASMEADVFLIDGELMIGHSLAEAKAGRPLMAVYPPFIDLPALRGPLAEGEKQRLILLVDIKTNGAAAWQKLRTMLEPIKARLAGEKPGPVRVVISGDRDIPAILGDAAGLAGVDGRFSDLPSELPAWRMPLISSDWKSHFAWRGVGPMPADEQADLRALTARAHKEGRLVRFWGSPDLPQSWAAQAAAGVDLINTDRPANLRAWLDAQSSPYSAPYLASIAAR
jgi:hypothetical protein